MSGSHQKKTAGSKAPARRNAWRLYWMLVVAALAVFAVMQAWSLPKLRADGMPAFDLRYLGYSFDEARAYLAALGEEGRTFYLNAQLVLDRLYPALYGPALAIALVALDARAGGRGWGWVLAVFAIAGMGFDWLEHAIFTFPELLLIMLAAMILLGRYTGYRLTELKRFKVLGEQG